MSETSPSPEAGQQQRQRVMRAMWAGGPLAPEDRSLAGQLARMPGESGRGPLLVAGSAAMWLIWVAILGWSLFGHGTDGARRLIGGIGATIFLLALLAGEIARSRLRGRLRREAH